MLTGSKKKIQLSRADYLIRITNYMWRTKIPMITTNVLQLLVFKQKYVLRLHITELTMLTPETSGDDCCLPGLVLRISSWPGSGSGDTLTGPCPPSHSVSEPEPVSPLSPLSPLSALAPDIPFNSDSGARHQAQNAHTSKPQKGKKRTAHQKK